MAAPLSHESSFPDIGKTRGTLSLAAMSSVTEQTSRWAKGVFYGWWVLLASMSVQVITSGFTVHAFGAYIAVMKAEFGWSTTALSFAFALQQAASGFLGPVIGWLIERIGSRRVVRAGVVIFAIGVGLLSLVNSLPALYGAVFVIAIGAALAGFLPLNTVAVQWFERWRSTALALMQTGISVGGLIIPIVAWALASYGWRHTAVATSLLALVVGIPLTFVIGNQPEDYDLVPDGKKYEPVVGEAPSLFGRDYTAKEAVKTRAFWFISFGHALALTVVFAVSAHLVLFLTSDAGFNLELAGIIVALMTAMSIVGQLLGGFLGDRFNKRLIAICAMFGHAGGLLMLAYGGTLPWAIAFGVVHGVSWGLRGPIMQSIRADYFGRRHFGQIMGYSSIIVTMGIVSGPLIAGSLADVFGNYQVGFTLLAGMATLGSVFFMLTKPPEKLE